MRSASRPALWASAGPPQNMTSGMMTCAARFCISPSKAATPYSDSPPATGIDTRRAISAISSCSVSVSTGSSNQPISSLDSSSATTSALSRSNRR